MPPECLFGGAWAESCPGGKAAAPRAGLKPGHGASQRSLLWFASKLLLSNLCRLLQGSASSLVHCWLDPGSLPESAASLHPSPLPGWTHCHGGSAEKPRLPQQEGHGLVSVWGAEGEASSLFAGSFSCCSWWASELSCWWHLGEGCGRVAGSSAGQRGRLWAVSAPEIHPECCCQQWWLLWLTVSNDSNQENIFEVTGLCSAVSKQPVLQLLSLEIMWIGSEIILLNAMIQGRASG